MSREKVEVYSNGLFFCSVCAPADLTQEQVEEIVNEINPCGTTGGWAVTEARFKGGEPNPCTPKDCPGTRHWLLTA